MSDTKILIVAGESSGDLHGSALVKALKEQRRDLSIYALGGPKIREAGAVLLEDMLAIAVVGLIEAVKHYRTFRDIFKRTVRWIIEERPDVVVLIDFPGFNLKLASEIKRLGIKVVYFVSPQIWAWGKGRIWKIKKLVDRMLVLFKFEEDMYRRIGMDVEHVGHPILDMIGPADQYREASLTACHESGQTLIGLLPGSRSNEIRAHLPVMLEAAQILGKQHDCHFVLGLADGISRTLISEFLPKGDFPLTIFDRGAYQTMANAKLVFVAAGTATLEAACFQVPMVIVYRISWITWCLGRIVVDVPFLGMVNLVAGKEIVPECLQSQAKPALIAQYAHDMLSDPTRMKHIKSQLQQVKEKLGSTGASLRAADSILEVCEKKAL